MLSASLTDPKNQATIMLFPMERIYRAAGARAAISPLPPGGKRSALILNGSKLNLDFRFVMGQGKKLRTCGDLRHSMANLAFVDLTPIKLSSMGPRSSNLRERCARRGVGAFLNPIAKRPIRRPPQLNYTLIWR